MSFQLKTISWPTGFEVPLYKPYRDELYEAFIKETDNLIFNMIKGQEVNLIEMNKPVVKDPLDEYYDNMTMMKEHNRMTTNQTTAATPPNPLPGVLFDTGCCFCGVSDSLSNALNPAVSAVVHHGFPPGVRVHTLCASNLGGWSLATAEYNRRKALSSPPSPAEGEAKVGERWLAGVRRNDAMHKQREVTITRVRDCYAEVDGGENYSALLPGHHMDHNWSTARRLSAPSADKWEPKPGEAVEGVMSTAMLTPGAAVRGKFHSFYASGNARVDVEPHSEVSVTQESLRPATPSPKAAAFKRSYMGDPATHPGDCECGDERCRAIGMAPVVVSTEPPVVFVPTPKLDPDGYLNREALDERRRGERLDFGARRLAAVQAHKLDFDRKIPTVRGRLAAEVKQTLRSFPSHDSGAGWED